MATRAELLATVSSLTAGINAVVDHLEGLADALRAELATTRDQLEKSEANGAALESQLSASRTDRDALLAEVRRLEALLAGGQTPPPSDDLEVITTPSGTWRLNVVRDHALTEGGLIEYREYRLQRDGNAGPGHRFVVRRAKVKDLAGDLELLDMMPVTIDGIAAAVAQGSVRVIPDLGIAPPDPERVRAWVARSGVAFARERDWRQPAVSLRIDTKRPTYDPLVLGDDDLDPATRPSANTNFVGTTSPQGGEYSASRSFIHDVDARVIDAALHGEDALILETFEHVAQHTWESLAQPQGSIHSFRHDVTADPQKPFPDERPWEEELWSSPAGDDGVDSMRQVDGWGRDVSHLENTGFAHWLLTGDPLAALVINRQTAYALAWVFAYKRKNKTEPRTHYMAYQEQERGLHNVLSSALKSYEIGRSIKLRSGRFLWDESRTNSIMVEVLDDYRQRMAATLEAAQLGDPRGLTLKVIGLLIGYGGVSSHLMADGTTRKLQTTSAFMGAQYGAEPLHWATKLGSVVARECLTGYATWMVGRLHHCGGAMGVDRRQDVRGSGMVIGDADAAGNKLPPAWSDVRGYGEWLKSLPMATTGPNDRFDGCYAHTAMRCEAMLLSAKVLGLDVPDLDEALASIAEQKARTDPTKLRGTDLVRMKNCFDPR